MDRVDKTNYYLDIAETISISSIAVLRRVITVIGSVLMTEGIPVTKV